MHFAPDDLVYYLMIVQLSIVLFLLVIKKKKNIKRINTEKVYKKKKYLIEER